MRGLVFALGADVAALRVLVLALLTFVICFFANAHRIKSCVGVTEVNPLALTVGGTHAFVIYLLDG
jgi:hypothetical protein